MVSLPPITLRLRGWKLIDRVALVFLVLCAIALGAGCGLLFVYASDLPEIRALETYRPDVVTEVYADDGQLAGSFALQRRILMTYEQCPKVLYNAVTAIEDQHFEEHWGIDFPRMFTAAMRNLIKRKITGGASTITMQLAGNLFLDRSDRSFRRKMQETLLALQIERRYTKPQIFTMYANQVYLAHGNYGFAAAAQFYFGKPVTDLKLQEASLLAGMVNGPKFSPLTNPELALSRRNLVLHRMEDEGKITPTEESTARKSPLGLHIQYPRNDLAPYFFEDIRKYLESTYGTEAVHERGLRVYTTLNIHLQRIANQSLRDGLHSYERRHGWKGNLPNILRDNLGKLDSYEDDDWRHAIEKGSYVTGLVMSVSEREAIIKIGTYRGILSPGDFAWTGRKKPAELLKVGDLAQFSIQELRDNTVRVQLEQQPGPQGALLAIDNSTGEIKAMIGGYSFEDSKFNRATQAVRQVGSSFKVYVYADALEKGSTPFDTIVDTPFTTISGGQSYSPHNYDEKFEGTITLRRALAGSRNVPAVKLAAKIGITTVVDMAKRFGITTPLPPYLPLALGAADMKLLEHVSAFTVFPNDGIRIDPHMIRRVTRRRAARRGASRSARRPISRCRTHHNRHARGSHSIRHRHTGQSAGPPRRWKNGNDTGLHRCLVCGIYAANHRGRVGGLRRQTDFAWEKGNRRTCCTSHLARIHARSGRRNASDGFPKRRSTRAAGWRASRKCGYSGYSSYRRRARRPQRETTRHGHPQQLNPLLPRLTLVSLPILQSCSSASKEIRAFIL